MNYSVCFDKHSGTVGVYQSSEHLPPTTLALCRGKRVRLCWVHILQILQGDQDTFFEEPKGTFRVSKETAHLAALCVLCVERVRAHKKALSYISSLLTMSEDLRSLWVQRILEASPKQRTKVLALRRTL